jgi:hypothetical protein
MQRRPKVEVIVIEERGRSPAARDGSGQQLTAHTDPGAEVQLGSAVALVCRGTQGEHAGSDKRSLQSLDRRTTADRMPTIPSCGRNPSIRLRRTDLRRTTHRRSTIPSFGSALRTGQT